MLRMMLLGLLIPLGVGVLAAMELKTPARSAAVPVRPVAEIAAGISEPRGALAKADRLEVTYARHETPSQSTLRPIDPIVPEVQKLILPAERNIVSRHWHDPNATSLSTAKSKRTAKKGKSTTDSGWVLV